MAYITRRRKFRDFLKNRNNTFYIVLIMGVLILACVGIVIAITAKNGGNQTAQPESTALASKEVESESEEADITGLYLIRINKLTHTIAAYSYNEEALDYATEPERVMQCGISSATAVLSGKVEHQKPYRLSWMTKGEKEHYRYLVAFSDQVVFHSAAYNILQDKTSLDAQAYNQIGSTGDSYGVTLSLADAKWLYNHLSLDSEIEIYADASEQLPLSGARIIRIPDDFAQLNEEENTALHICGTDPSETLPESLWCPVQIAQFNCPATITIDGAADDAAIFRRISITDDMNNSLNDYAVMKFIGKYSYYKTGVNHFILYIADIYGNFYSQEVEMIINNGAAETESATNSETMSAPEQTTSPTSEPETELITEEFTTMEPSVEPTSDTTKEPEETTLEIETSLPSIETNIIETSDFVSETELLTLESSQEEQEDDN